MKITEKQIEELYAFTRLHYVEHFDVQIELVDHMANDIEELCKNQPELSFEEAKSMSFKKFGVFGFQDVISSRVKSLERKYFKLFWTFIQEWFHFPKVLFTLFLIAGVYTFLGFQISNFLIFSIVALYIFYLGCRMYYWNRIYRERIKRTKKKWLMEGYIYRTVGTGTMGINFITQLLIYIDLDISNTYIRILYSVCIVSVLLAFYVLVEVIPKKAEELLEMTYPEYKLEQNK